jgi:glycosyltransferase involved in cell wall biosynthesis
MANRILIMTNEFFPFPGGIARYATALAEAASSAGDEIIVLAPRSSAAETVDYDRKAQFRVVRLPYPENSLLRLLTWVSVAFFFTLTGKYQVIHAADFSSGMALNICAKITGIRFRVSVHGTDLLTMRSSRAVRNLCHSDPFEFAEGVFCNSNYTKQTLQSCYEKTDKEKIHVAYPGVSPSWFAKPEEAISNGAAHKWALADGGIKIITVARLERRKNQHVVIGAIERLAGKTDQRFTYLLVGGAGCDEYQKQLRDLAREVSYPVIFTGRISDSELHGLYNAADLLCMPGTIEDSRVEGFGLVYLEAAACGVPSIGSRVGGIPEVIRHGETGILIDEVNVEQLEGAIAALTGDANLREKLSHAASKWASSFSWRTCANEIYRTVTT